MTGKFASYQGESMKKRTAFFRSTCFPPGLVFRIGIILLIIQSVISCYGNTWTWSGGGGANGNWNDSANWNFAGIPTNGDTLVFQGTSGVNNTNNIANLTLNQIRFNSGGFNLYGDAFTLTNDIIAANTSGVDTINPSVTNDVAGLGIIVSNAASLTLSGTINGPGSLTFTGSGTLTFNGASPNTYAGATVVNGGTLLLGKTAFISSIPGALVIGSNATVSLESSWQLYSPAKTVTMADSSVFNLAGFNEWVGAISLQGAQITAGTGILYFSGNITVNSSTVAQSVISGNADIWGGTYTITNSGHNYSPDLTFSANLSSEGSGDGLVKAGAGEVSLSGSNTFTGPVTVTGGNLWAQTATALGDTNYAATVEDGGSIFLYGSALDFGLKPLVLGGTGYAFGALSCNGTCSWEGNVTLTDDSQIYLFGGSSLTVSGPIGGAGALTLTGSGTLTLSGTNADTYAGTTTVNSGSTLLLGKSISEQTIPGNLVINGTVLLGASEQTTNSADVLINSGGLFNFSNNVTLLNTLHGLGTVNFGAGGWVNVGENNGSSEFDGSFTGTGFSRGYTVGKVGSGTFTMGGNSTYTAGINHIYGGTMVINGSQPTIPVTVEAGATLSGSGTVGAITANGIISPGGNVGILNSGNVGFSSSGDLAVQLTGPNPGLNGYDQLNVAGTVSLASAGLTVTPAFATPVAVGQQFDILNNDGSEAVTGIFNGLAEGAAINVGGYNFTISYLGGTGNDVTLTLTGIPGAVTSSSVTSGNGNHSIDPDECNNLDLVITNYAASPMNNISATLSTTTEDVLITQPYSEYADVAANGTGTNVIPFQISTLPGFVCGSDINLQLSVSSSLGSFTTPYVLSTGEASATPFRYDSTGNVTIPTDGTVDSTNFASDFTGFPLSKVAVSLYLTDSLDSALTNLSLIAPDGTTVLLSAANGGSGKNYGSGLTPDSNRTTFDDAALTSITNGTAPFVGIYRPQSPLSTFIGNATPNGAWHLHLANGGGSPGALLGWSLFLYPVACLDGGGNCDVCLQAVTDAITSASSVQTNRWDRDGIVSSCGSSKAWSGFGDIGTNFHYNAYTFTNTSGAEACVTVELQSTNDVMAATYLSGYNAASISNNFWGDAGISTAQADDGVTTYSSEIPEGATFVVVVNEVTQASGTQPYTLTLSGLPCPPPTLNIETVKPNQTHLFWPTWAGGYALEAVSSLTNATWTGVTNEPIVNSSQFNVTNTMNPTNQFYRLYKP